MGQLQGLKGTDGRKIDCMFIESGKEIEVILQNNKAATAADNNGAINVYKDDEDNIRCEVMRYCKTLEEKTFKTFAPAIKWVDKWILKIN